MSIDLTIINEMHQAVTESHNFNIQLKNKIERAKQLVTFYAELETEDLKDGALQINNKKINLSELSDTSELKEFLLDRIISKFDVIKNEIDKDIIKLPKRENKIDSLKVKE